MLHTSCLTKNMSKFKLVTEVVYSILLMLLQVWLQGHHWLCVLHSGVDAAPGSAGAAGPGVVWPEQSAGLSPPPCALRPPAHPGGAGAAAHAAGQQPCHLTGLQQPQQQQRPLHSHELSQIVKVVSVEWWLHEAATACCRCHPPASHTPLVQPSHYETRWLAPPRHAVPARRPQHPCCPLLVTQLSTSCTWLLDGFLWLANHT